MTIEFKVSPLSTVICGSGMNSNHPAFWALGSILSRSANHPSAHPSHSWKAHLQESPGLKARRDVFEASRFLCPLRWRSAIAIKSSPFFLEVAMLEGANAFWSLQKTSCKCPAEIDLLCTLPALLWGKGCLWLSKSPLRPLGKHRPFGISTDARIVMENVASC